MSGGISAFFGITTIPFVILSFFGKNKHKYFWTAVLVISFFLVMGKYNPAYKLLYYIPLINKFRAPARHWSEFGLALSVLTGFGFNNLIRLEKRKLKKVNLVSIVIISLLIAGFFRINQVLKGYEKYNFSNDIKENIDSKS